MASEQPSFTEQKTGEAKQFGAEKSDAIKSGTADAKDKTAIKAQGIGDKIKGTFTGLKEKIFPPKKM